MLWRHWCKVQVVSDYLTDLENVLRTESGRRVLWSILSQANVFSLSYTGEVNSTMFNEGKRNVGNELMAHIQQVDVGLFLLMQKENIERIKLLNEKEKENAIQE